VLRRGRSHPLGLFAQTWPNGRKKTDRVNVIRESSAMKLTATTALITAAILVSAPAFGGILVQDEFDDGTVETNTNGIGGPYNHETWSASESEVSTGGESYYQIDLSSNYGNGGLVTYEDGDVGSGWDGHFNAWTADGVTSTVRAGQNQVTDDDVVRGIFGITDGTNDKDDQSDALVPYHNRQGAIWMRLAYQQNTSETDLTVSGSIIAAAADKESDGTSSAVFDVLASFTVNDWDGQAWRTFQIYVNDQGWQAYAEGDIEWTDEFSGSVIAGNTYGQTWTTVNSSASFTTDDPGDESDHLDDTVFADALANLGINGNEGRGHVRFDSWQVETGDALVPEPATLTILALGGLGGLLKRRTRNG
jgi:hypothetical protein